MKGMIHIYTGEGKGKTTAAMGLALRAAGHGKRVLIIQFLKGRDSGEIAALAPFPAIAIRRNSKDYGFFRFLSGEEQQALTAEHDAALHYACEQACAGKCDLLILDEALAAYNLGALDRARLDELLLHKPSDLELVLTGRDAPPHMLPLADYVTELRNVKHPYDRGIGAREGIEY